MSAYTLNPIAKATWVSALREQERTQATGCLRDNGGMCCLGVAADVSKLGAWERNENGQFFYNIGDDTSRMVTPDDVSEWLNFPLVEHSFRGEVLREANPIIPGLEGRAGGNFTFTELNDSVHLTFAQIADLIDYFL